MPILETMKHIIRYFLCAVTVFLCVTALYATNASRTVKKGDTLYSLAKEYKVSVADLRKANSMDSDDIIYIGQILIIPTAANTKIYTVENGDTLFSIAISNNSTLEELYILNNLDKNSVIYIGQKIKVPASYSPTTDSVVKTTQESSEPKTITKKYKVQKGDTLYSIAESNNTTVDKLRKLNGLTTKSVIKIGQSLIVQNDTVIASGQVANVTDPRQYETKKGNPSLIWPVKAKAIAYVTGKISGVAITGSVNNESVTAIREGVVMYSGNYRGYGAVVFLKSSGGYIYMYSGLASLSVTKGQSVSYKQEIGKVGIDTYSGKPVVNLMVYKNDDPIDPAKAPRG